MKQLIIIFMISLSMGVNAQQTLDQTQMKENIFNQPIEQLGTWDDNSNDLFSIPPAYAPPPGNNGGTGNIGTPLNLNHIEHIIFIVFALLYIFLKTHKSIKKRSSTE